MIILFVLYVVFFILYHGLKIFNNSLEETQYYHNRLISKFEGGTDNKLESCLKFCCMSSILYKWDNSSNTFNHFDKYIPDVNSIKIIQGLDIIGNVCNAGAVFETQSFIFISFISTSNISDLLFGYKSSLVDVDNGLIHEGFYQKANSVYTSLLFILNELSSKKPLIITGHSLGGAIASIIGFMLIKDFGNRFGKIDVFTFGSPKWGNCQLKRFLEKKSYILSITNIVNTADFIVTKPNDCVYKTIGKNVKRRIDTGNDIINHGIKVYLELIKSGNGKNIPKRKYRVDEITFSLLINFFGN